jgi:hypothetical protein
MKITLHSGLPFVSATIVYKGESLEVEHVLIDTGSGGTVFAADKLARIDVFPEPEDALHRIAGVGGSEYVFGKRVDELIVGELHVEDFQIEVGALDYGFTINGIIGVDYLIATGAVIDLKRLELYVG